MKRLDTACLPLHGASQQNRIKKVKRFTWLRHGLPAAILLFFFAAPVAYAQVDFSQTVTFGDSLTNNDFLGLVYGNPQDMYGADPMQAVFQKGAKSGDHLTSYAVASATSDYLQAEIDAYQGALLIGEQDKATLISIEIGGDDVLNNLDLLRAYPPGQNKSADNVINNLIRNIRAGFSRLKNLAPNAKFVLWTLPDVTLTPREWQVNTPTETANIRAHLRRVNNAIRQLAHSPSVVVADLYTLLQSLVANPPVYYGQALLPPPTHGEYDAIFADEIHPTAVSNALIANAIIRQMNQKLHSTIFLYKPAQLAYLAHIKR